MIDEDEEPTDAVEESGGRVDCDEQGRANVPEDPELKDYWTLTNDVLAIHHLKPRLKMFVPTEQTLPIPVEYLDIMRTTVTNIDNELERRIVDYWYDNPQAGRDLTIPWTGRTTFDLLKPKPDPGWSWQAGRLTKIQKTTRPPDIRSEEWGHMSKKDKKKAIDLWAEEGPRQDALRNKRGLHHIPKEGEKDYWDKLKAAREKITLPPAPAMPCVPGSRENVQQIPTTPRQPTLTEFWDSRPWSRPTKETKAFAAQYPLKWHQSPEEKAIPNYRELADKIDAMLENSEHKGHREYVQGIH